MNKKKGFMMVNFKVNNYKKNIKIYYKNDYYKRLAKKTIEDIWFNNKNDKIRLIKNIDKGKVYKTKYKGENYFIKSYSHKKFRKLFKNLFRPVDAIRHCKTISELKNANISVMEPVLSLTYKKNSFVTDSIFVTREVKGISILDFLKKDNLNIKKRKYIIKKLGIIWGKLLNNNFMHQDPSLSNYIINFNTGELTLIDVDNLYKIPISISKILLQSLARLYDLALYDFDQASAKPLTYRERILFVKFLLLNYKPRLDKKEFINYINDLTIERLIKKDKKYLIKKDKILNNIYKRD